VKIRNNDWLACYGYGYGWMDGSCIPMKARPLVISGLFYSGGWLAAGRWRNLRRASGG